MDNPAPKAAPAADPAPGVGHAAANSPDAEDVTAAAEDALIPVRPDDGEPPADQGVAVTPPEKSSLFGVLALYTALRVALVAALTAVLMLFMPLIVALLFAIIVQLPLAWVLFAGPRRRVNEATAQASQRRREERSRLQAALRGDDSEI